MPKKFALELKRNSLKRRLRQKNRVNYGLMLRENICSPILHNESTTSNVNISSIGNVPSSSSKDDNFFDDDSVSDPEMNLSINYDDEYEPRFNLTDKIESHSDDLSNLSTEDLLFFLRTWALKNNIKMIALNEILKFFKSRGYPRLPVDSRTVLSTPRNMTILNIDPGKYVHVGISIALQKILTTQENLPKEITIDFNIDGLPISKSSNSCFWLILGKSSISKYIFVVGIYHGYNKPKLFNEFLRPFVDEIKNLSDHYSFQNQPITIKIGNFICDTPARSSVLGVKSHTAYFGCNQCTQEGEHIKSRMTFPEVDSVKRTDYSFRNKSDENHHNNATILEDLSINMIDQFPFDYLHVVCLGVVKRFLRMWMVGTSESLLSSHQIETISTRLKSISLLQPSEFQRKLRPLSQLSYFKGTEYRAFLLYAAPFVLKDVLSKDKYYHFLLLHVAIRLLSTNDVPKKVIQLSQTMLNEFIFGVKQLYSAHHIVFNVHALAHLPGDVERNGNINMFSSFPFESFMYQIKSLLRKNSQPLSQIYNRLMELSDTPELEIRNSNEYPILKRQSEITTTLRKKNNICRNRFSRL